MVNTWTSDRTGRTVSVMVVVTSDEPLVFEQDSTDEGDEYGTDDGSLGP